MKLFNELKKTPKQKSKTKVKSAVKLEKMKK